MYLIDYSKCVYYGILKSGKLFFSACVRQCLCNICANYGKCSCKIGLCVLAYVLLFSSPSRVKLYVFCGCID